MNTVRTMIQLPFALRFFCFKRAISLQLLNWQTLLNYGASFINLSPVLIIRV